MKSKEVIWEKNISPVSNGVIEIESVKGSYSLELHTEDAKKIKVNLSLNESEM